MTKKSFYLFMTVFMIVTTTIAMFAGFATLPVSRTSMMMICCLTTIGYLAAFAYFDSYIKTKTSKTIKK